MEADGRDECGDSRQESQRFEHEGSHAPSPRSLELEDNLAVLAQVDALLGQWRPTDVACQSLQRSRAAGRHADTSVELEALATRVERLAAPVEGGGDGFPRLAPPATTAPIPGIRSRSRQGHRFSVLRDRDR